MEDKNLSSNADSDSSYNDMPSNNKGSKSKIIIVLVLVLVIGGGAVGVMSYINELKGELSDSGIKTEPNLFLNEEDAQEYLADKVSAINVTMNTNVVCEKDENGTLMATVGLENLNTFQYVVKFKLESGETIAETGLIPAGRSVEKVALSKPLEKGTYPVNVFFTAISDKDNKTDLGSTGVSVDFFVVG